MTVPVEAPTYLTPLENNDPGIRLRLAALVEEGGRAQLGLLLPGGVTQRLLEPITRPVPGMDLDYWPCDFHRRQWAEDHRGLVHRALGLIVAMRSPLHASEVAGALMVLYEHCISCDYELRPRVLDYLSEIFLNFKSVDQVFLQAMDLLDSDCRSEVSDCSDDSEFDGKLWDVKLEHQLRGAVALALMSFAAVLIWLVVYTPSAPPLSDRLDRDFMRLVELHCSEQLTTAGGAIT